MALKQFYTNEADIPTEWKSEYVLKDGRWELQVEGFESITGVFAKNSELITKQKTDKAEIDRQTGEVARLNGEVGKLMGDLSRAQAGAIPTGYIAVPKKDSELIDKIKKENLKTEEVLEGMTELSTLREKVKESDLEKAIAAFAEVEKVSNVKALTRLIKQDGVVPVIKEVDENGQKVKKGYLVKTVDDKADEKTYGDYKQANWSEFATALDHTDKTPKPGNTGDPKPLNPATDEEAAKAAQSGQALATHNFF